MTKLITEQDRYMRRCIQLAKMGAGHTSPNPMVGAVVVCDGKIIGEGYHVRCGEAHAEVNAINSVKDKERLKRATLYVSLEPCSHHGRTPPCSSLIKAMMIPKVVVGSLDPFQKVSGRGIESLRKAGVDVMVGVMESECRELNKKFFLFHERKRPFLFLKWAQSADGYIDEIRTSPEQQAAKFSNDISQIKVHRLRSEYDAIMIGKNTALLDNPSLTVRYWSGSNPYRIVLDRNLELPDELTVFDKKNHTMVFTCKSKQDELNTEYLKIENNKNQLRAIIDALYIKGIQSVMIEGGASLLQSFINENLWDEANIEIANINLSDGVEAPFLRGKCIKKINFRNSEISTYLNQNPA